MPDDKKPSEQVTKDYKNLLKYGGIEKCDFWDMMDAIDSRNSRWEKFVDGLYKIKWKILNMWERLYCRFKFGYKPHIIKTGLSPAYYYDTDHRMLYGMMNLLVEFIEKEEPFEVVNWESDPEHSNAAKEMKAIYEWWGKYPELLKREETATSEWHEYHKKRKMPDFCNEEEERLLHVSGYLEEDRCKQEQDMLMRLIKIRQFLWT